jgi:hypothetical protein
LVDPQPELAFLSCIQSDIFGHVRVKLDIYYTCINGGLVRSASGSAMFSTLEDGKIVEGLAGVPNEGPVLLVGYHMLMGLQLSSLVERFLIEKNIMVRGLAHPTLFLRTFESSSSNFFLVIGLKCLMHYLSQEAIFSNCFQQNHTCFFILVVHVRLCITSCVN